EAVFGLIVMGLLTFTVVRFGLLTITVALFVSNLLSSVPLSPSPSDWWATSGNLSLILLAGLVAFGFYAARAGQPLFGRLVAEE
ncbi:MAG TPA: hypothetical protein VND92_10470, partial [Vicinamibacterales bacterium]|nr:hypothetical protein [Vicinamibacterales bacterium]